MAKTFLIFNFGADEETAQKARHRIEAWKQAFRLGNKLQFKVERPKPEGKNSGDPEQSGSQSKEQSPPIRMLVELDFSPHEKHLFQTWLARIPGEEPFRDARPETIPQGSAEFEATSDLFDSLD